MEPRGNPQPGEAAMKHTITASPRPSKNSRSRARVRKTRPAGEQAIGSRLYAQIRQAIAELKR